MTADGNATSEAVRGALDQNVKDVREAETGEQRREPAYEVAKEWERQTPKRAHALRVDEVEGIAPGPGSYEVTVRGVVFAVSDFVLDPEVSEDTEPNHGLREMHFCFEMQHLRRPAAEPDQKAPGVDTRRARDRR